MYFLFGAVLAAAVPQNLVPIAWYTMVFPLLFVVGVTLLKDGYEDYVRVNNVVHSPNTDQY